MCVASSILYVAFSILFAIARATLSFPVSCKIARVFKWHSSLAPNTRHLPSCHLSPGAITSLFHIIGRAVAHCDCTSSDSFTMYPSCIPSMNSSANLPQTHRMIPQFWVKMAIQLCLQADHVCIYLRQYSTFVGGMKTACSQRLSSSCFYQNFPHRVWKVLAFTIFPLVIDLFIPVPT